MEAEKKRILFVDDEFRLVESYATMLNFSGFDVTQVASADEAVMLINNHSFDLVILDIMMPPGEHFRNKEAEFGLNTGVKLALLVREKLPEAAIVAFSNHHDPNIREFFSRTENMWYMDKSNYLLDDFVETIKEIAQQRKPLPRAFIVHGRDHRTLSELKNFLEKQLNLKKILVLSEQPSRGMTLIEKFEYYAAATDIVFVLFTPDDLGGLVGASEYQARPRMNVIFELGYFLGALRRRSGRVFLLTKGDMEIPTDISGIVYVDITNGVESAESAILTELKDWL